jgi:putative ABC transport system permease protein
MRTPRFFRMMLRLLPFDFRADYGRDIEQTFQEQRRAAHTSTGLARVWAQTVRDLFRIGPREHLAQLRQDVRYAMRNMARQPGFVAAAVLTLAVGIGVNTAIFSVVHAVLLRPLPYPDAERVVAVWNRWEGTAEARHSDPEYLDLAERSRTLDLAAVAGNSMNIAGERGDPERVLGALGTANTFQVLGIAPALGRGFLADEEREGRDHVVVLSHDLWRRRFNSDPAVLGQTLLVNGTPHQIIGVMPAEVRLPVEYGSDTYVSVFVPLTLDRAAPRNIRGGHYLFVYGRLRAGASVQSAEAELDALVAALARQYPDGYDQGGFDIYVRPVRQQVLGESRQTLLILAAAVGMVLLLACANVTNLMLARGESRRGELAVRTALGASRLRIVRQLLTEALVLSSIGALAGLALAAACQKLLLLWLDEGAVELPRLGDVSLNLPVLLFTAGLAVCTAVLFGLFPALQVSQVRVSESLSDGARGSTAGGRRIVRRLLVAAQVTLATVLLIASALLVKSFLRVLQEPIGFASERVLTFRVSLPESRYPGLREVADFYTRLVDRVSALPGAEAVGASTGLPMSVASGDWSFDIEGRGLVNGKRPGRADWYVVTPGYFEALRVKLVRGRLPQPSDDERAAPVVFLNEASARTIFPNEDPVGKRIRLSNTTGPEQPWRTIAGVVADVRTLGRETPPGTEMYIPHRQFLHFAAGAQARAMTVVARTGMDPMALMPSVRAGLARLDPMVPAAEARDMETVVARSVADRRMLVMLIGGFGWLAILLASIGVYGVMDYSVRQRTREIGVRIAVGAPRTAVLALIVGQALRMVALGIAAGLVAAALFGSALASLLYQVQPRDTGAFVLASVLLGAIGLGASYLPARRASKVDPVTALRAG